MTYKDNTPTFNVNRKVVNFKDFSANPNAEKEELEKVDRQNKPNTDDQQKNMGNSRYKFNNTTRKMDDLSPAEIKDKIDAIEELEESIVNESHIDYEVMNKIQKTEAYKTLKEEFKKSIDTFNQELKRVSDEIGYDEGDSDHDKAYNAAIQEALDEHIGW
jgi:hypothetical protein